MVAQSIQGIFKMFKNGKILYNSYEKKEFLCIEERQQRNRQKDDKNTNSIKKIKQGMILCLLST